MSWSSSKRGARVRVRERGCGGKEEEEGNQREREGRDEEEENKEKWKKTTTTTISLCSRYEKDEIYLYIVQWERLCVITLGFISRWIFSQA